MKKNVPYTDLNRFWRRYRRNRLAVFGICFLTVLVVAALLAEVIAPEGYDAQNYKIKFTSPNWEHPLGTDYLGRDNLVRVIYGARISLSIGVSTTIIGTAIAVFIGMMAGFYGGKSDNILMRIMDVFLSIPSILLSIVLASVLGGGVVSMIIALSLGAIPGVSRLVRAMVIPLHSAQHLLIPYRVVHHGRGGRHPQRLHTELPGVGRPGAQAGVGQDALRRTEQLPRLSLSGAGTGRGDYAHGIFLEHDWRRFARCAGPAAER